MSLVPYDGSDISDSEEETEINNLPVKIESKPGPPKPEIVQNQEIINNISNNSLFNLPTPKATYSEIIKEEENDEFLQKKPEKNLQEKKPVKISIPSLSQFDEDEISNNIPLKKFRPASTKGTGLFSILPPPKTGSNTSLVPQSVKKPKPVQTPLVPRAIKKQVEEKLKQKIDHISTKNQTNGVTHDEDDDDNDTGTDFFSLDKSEPEYYPELSEEEDKHAEVIEPCVEPMPSASQYIPLVASENVSQFESNQVMDNRLGLDEAALQALIGSKGKRKMETASAQILDLHEHDIKPDNKEWYQNALLQGTGPEEHEAVKAVPGGVLKRKHQITYLAQQAKANEQQLKNMWAQNRATRQQTQSKYGF